VRKSQKRVCFPDILRPQRKTNQTQINETEEPIMKYVCDICGWEYNEAEGYPEGGIAPGTKWEDLPEDFVCPLCSVEKDNFSEA
jgi:rubredoxin-NAD+ reductase